MLLLLLLLLFLLLFLLPHGNPTNNTIQPTHAWREIKTQPLPQLSPSDSDDEDELEDGSGSGDEEEEEEGSGSGDEESDEEGFDGKWRWRRDEESKGVAWLDRFRFDGSPRRRKIDNDDAVKFKMCWGKSL